MSFIKINHALAEDIGAKCGFLPITVKIAVRLVLHGLPDGKLLTIHDSPKHAITVPTSECEEYLEHYSMKISDPYSI